MMIIILILFY